MILKAVIPEITESLQLVTSDNALSVSLASVLNDQMYMKCLIDGEKKDVVLADKLKVVEAETPEDVEFLLGYEKQIQASKGLITVNFSATKRIPILFFYEELLRENSLQKLLENSTSGNMKRKIIFSDIAVKIANDLDVPVYHAEFVGDCYCLRRYADPYNESNKFCDSEYVECPTRAVLVRAFLKKCEEGGR